MTRFDIAAEHHRNAEHIPDTNLPTRREFVQRRNDDRKQRRIEITPPTRVCDAAGIATVEESGAGLRVHGEVSSMLVEAARIDPPLWHDVNCTPNRQGSQQAEVQPAMPSDVCYDVEIAVATSVVSPQGTRTAPRQ